MQIAVLITPEIKNIGNAFINRGALALIDKIKYSNTIIHKIEARETSNNLFNYPTKCLTEYNRQVIEGCDWLIVIGGSCLSRYMVDFFTEIGQLNVKKILLGAGFYEGIEKELELHKTLPEQFDYIFARDQETTMALIQEGKYENVYSGIDLAFWMDEHKDADLLSKNIKPYSVINIDSPERGGLQARLCAENKDHIISRNNSYATGICNAALGKDHKCFVAENWYEYTRLYANARYVATNRVHTLLACILFDTPCQPFLDYTSSYERFFLFKQIGLEVETAKTYSVDDYKPFKKVLEGQKFQMEEQLTSILWEK